MKNTAITRYRFSVITTFVLITIFYAWTYAAAPLPEMLNTLILNGGTTLSALIVALILTRIVFYFQQGEPPRAIWISFAVCVWLWTIAEGVWGYIYTMVGEVPAFSAADILWLVGYVALTISLARQIELVSFARKRTVRWSALGVWLGMLAIIEVILLANRSESPLEDFFSYFYLLADTAVGLSALYLAHAFRGRALAIPWMTISSFVLSDFIYLRLTGSGAYDYVMSGVSVALLADTLYLVAYFVVAWGVLEQYLLLRSSADHAREG